MAPAQLVAPRGLAGTYKEVPTWLMRTRPSACQILTNAWRCVGSRSSTGWVSSAQADRVVRILNRFVSFAAGASGVTSVDGVTPEIAGAFVRAPLPDGTPPSVALLHLRRTALRLLFRCRPPGRLG